ncbi:RIP metalloprotease RseP [Viscerimonas tarda]
MEIFLIKALQLILSLSILVIVHEFGHFLFARIFKIRVEKFYLFFNPGFSLFKYKPHNSETEYGIGWLPLGGYVKIAGMIDESMDKEQLKLPPQPYEFRSKPSWQRLLVMVGGVVFNFILALFIYSMILFSWGDSYVKMDSVENGMSFSQTVKDAGGFQDHDIILSLDGEEMRQRAGITSINTLMQFLNADTIRVSRNGEELTLNIPHDFADKVIASEEKIPPFTIWGSTKIDSVAVDSPADRAGLQKGDSIVEVNKVPVTSFAEFTAQIRNDEYKKTRVPIVFYRNSVRYIATVYINEQQIIGVIGTTGNYETGEDEYGFFASIPAGISFGMETLKAYIAQIRFIFTEKGFKGLGGFGAIGGLFPAEWDWHAFWMMTSFLSIILAVMNILPVPALDGGHVMFLLYEVITRRKPNDKFVERAQVVGMVLLFALLIYANGNDLFKAIFK